MINILMCTYNGEKYLRRQIDSILCQTYKDFCLFIRDDGSDDEIIEIIEEYRERYTKLIKVIEDEHHLGYPDCFWNLLGNCDSADLYAFCDQDDIWRKDKLECAVRAYEAFYKKDSIYGSCPPEAIPTLYIHEYLNCDKNLHTMSRHHLGGTNALTDMSILFYTYASGFSMVINDAMRRAINGADIMGHDMYHDELCIWIAHFYGKIIYDKRVLAKYRRHEATETKYGNGIPTLIDNYIKRELAGDYFTAKCKRVHIILIRAME